MLIHMFCETENASIAQHDIHTSAKNGELSPVDYLAQVK